MEWFANENFWRDFYPFMFSEERFGAAVQEVGQLIELARPAGKAVLDLCCGPGRHSVEFARRGFQVTGVDRSPFLLSRASEHASASNVSVEWVQQDMRDFCRPETYDFACSLFTSFGYFEDDADQERVLGNIYKSLKRGGCVIIDVKGKEGMLRQWKDSIVSQCADGSYVIQLPRLHDDCTRVRNEWLLVKDGHSSTYSFDLFVYSGRELRDLLLRAGFAHVTLYGDLLGSAYDLSSPRLVAVARKSN